ncbi:hypothetical protein AU099_gp94 [Gordonia phage GTE8]|uniref:Uncharacterized protein n=1 Tax=Gordonia phage GTE8 TaxID=1647475 RepID=A0A0K0N6T4_9CAUD|nr:hypothetical protein AU099_gp94 [Gordonia phage GTE8]AKJ72437.1 hypothetical protein GTE8_94 [Gordonia phage GTE8]
MSGMRFREEFAVEWMRVPRIIPGIEMPLESVQSEPTRSEEVAVSAAKWLNRQPGIMLARVLTRTVREERDHWWRPWRTTGLSKWFEQGEVPDGSPVVEIDPAV